ncbi:ParB/RepB/Spo0J family partition protein [Psychromarinibacter sp. S121]|uniref:ParB/RepB/Spo0J family partition protein n=1 Tax=Psychromarinibacter sp. S121 TaxID=3415127 RepID=UPI003C7DB716
MAKRRRLSPAQSDYLETQTAALETRSMPLGRAPIAQVAGEASTTAALEELAGTLREARAQGRMIEAVPLERIEAGYLVRDRLAADDEELQALMESLRARGQQTPVELVDLGQGRYGLISGWRRLTALGRLLAETGDDRFATALAVLRRPETAADAYVAMVEENEIRVGLSYYERARVAAKAVEQGVFETEKKALLSLYASASRAKRSKIRSFLELYHAADDLLRFPSAIGERLGMALAKALDGRGSRQEALRAALDACAPDSAAEEQAVLEGMLTVFEQDEARAAAPEPKPVPPGAPGTVEGVKPEAAPAAPRNWVAPGIYARWDGRKLELDGQGMTDAFHGRLMDWIRANT